MYKVIVVDDEDEIREGIIKRMPWEELGFIVVGDADNGIDALELVEQTQPQVLISDIRIPFMNGLELAEKVQESSLSTKIIFISGFDDFDYTKKAIQLNVVDYIIKPVTAKELGNVLEKVKESLDEEQALRLDNKRMQEIYKASMPIMQEQFIQKLLSENEEEEYLAEEAKRLDIGFLADENNSIAVAYISVDKKILNNKVADVPYKNQESLLPFFLSQSIKEVLSKKYPLHTFVRSEGIIMFVPITQECTISRLIKDLNTFCQFVQSVLHRRVAAGIGNPVNSLSELGRSYHEASTAYIHSSFNDKEEAIYIGDIQNVNKAPKLSNRNYWKDISIYVSRENSQALERAMKKLFLDLSSRSWNKKEIQKIGMDFLAGFLQLSKTYELDIDEMLGESRNLIEEVAACNILSDLERWSKEICMKISQSIQLNQQTTADRMANEAKVYVLNHFHEHDLSVEKICSFLHLSPTYFSSTFKKQTGQSFVSFLTEIRLNEAKRLLENSDEKTYVISSMVGYMEPNYFSYAFKKKVGVSPTTYRKEFFAKEANE